MTCATQNTVTSRVVFPAGAVYAVAGPTASGKTDLALALAEQLDGEIVCCDSVQVYRGFDIGSAKPSTAERARAPHHLLDVVDASEAFDAQHYILHAKQALADIAARGKVAILCGGTGLYLRTLRWGLVQEGQSDPVLRAELLAAEARTPGTTYARLQQVDPASAAALERNNVVHVMRALEMSLVAGEPASIVRARHGFRKAQVPMQVLSLEWAAEVLRARIAERTHAMLRHGLVEEVEHLLAQGVGPACRPMCAVGYREAVEMLQGRAPRDTLAARIAHNTWQYARRQRTWLRRERDVLSLSMPADVEKARTLLGLAAD